MKMCLSSPQDAMNQFFAEYTNEFTPLAWRLNVGFQSLLSSLYLY